MHTLFTSAGRYWGRDREQVSLPLPWLRAVLDPALSSTLSSTGRHSVAPASPPSDPSRGSTGPTRRSAMGGGAPRSGGGGRPAFAPTGASGTAGGPRAGAAGATAAAPGGRRAAAGGGGSGKKGLIDYPRHGKTGIRRWLPSWRLVLGIILFLAALAVAAFAYLYASTDIPEPSDFADYQTTTVYYSDGATEMGTFAEQNRTIVEGSTIPEHVKQAVVAAEDRSFYENPGINPAGIVRALWNNLRGNDTQGGSSITQQYAERYYFGETVSDYEGKLKEALLAIRLDRAQDKDVILANYLNTIYFGRDSYGIEAAAQAYFGVGAAELTVSQGAMIAGIIPSPNNWDPRENPEKAEQRWNYVLDGMVITGALSQAERDAQVLPETVEDVQSDTMAGPQGYLLDMVRRELEANGSIPEAELRVAGYKIVTTIDAGLQRMMLDTVATMPTDHAPELRVGMVTLNPTDGSIVALYGGPDFLTQSVNAVTQATAQAGSTFKPFTLAAYLSNGGSLKSEYVGPSPMEVGDGEFENFGGQDFGEIDVVEATAKSVNTVYAQMNEEIGPEKTVEAARVAGLPEAVLAPHTFVSNVLGPASPNPLDMAQAYNTFAAEGARYEPFIVLSVEHPDGRVAYNGGSNPEQAFPADVMADTVYAMTQVVEAPGGTATKAAAVGHPVAGKTGTSTANKSAWFIGFTQHLTTSVTLFQQGPGGAEMDIAPFGGYGEITGGSVPLDLWTDYMTKAMADREVLPFPERADIGEPNTPPIVAIPDVVGMTEADALNALGAAGFSAVVQRANDPAAPEGTVFQQNPTGEAEQGSQVVIIVSDGPGVTAVPDVVGRAAGDARATLEGAGFAVAESSAESFTVPEGQVISQDPGAGAEAAPGSTVTIVVSSGPPDAPDPPGPSEPPGTDPGAADPGTDPGVGGGILPGIGRDD